MGCNTQFNRAVISKKQSHLTFFHTKVNIWWSSYWIKEIWDVLLSLFIRSCDWASAVMKEMHSRISFYLLIPRSYYSTQHEPLSIRAATCCPFSCLQSTVEDRPQPPVTFPLTCYSSAFLSSHLTLREFDHWGVDQLKSSTVDTVATIFLRKPSTWGGTQRVWFFRRTADQSESF